MTLHDTSMTLVLPLGRDKWPNDTCDTSRPLLIYARTHMRIETDFKGSVTSVTDSRLTACNAVDSHDIWSKTSVTKCHEVSLTSDNGNLRDIPLGELRFNGARMRFEEA